MRRRPKNSDGDLLADERPLPGIVQFVSILPKPARVQARLPATFPPGGESFVRVFGTDGPFVFELYRRHMRTIGHLGEIDKLCGAPATTRNWNTMKAIVRVLMNEPGQPLRRRNRGLSGAE